MLRIGFLVYILLGVHILSSRLQVQVNNDRFLAETEDSLYHQFEYLYSLADDQSKKEFNDRIIGYFREVLNERVTFAYPFDSLTRIGRLYSPDKRFRLITWNVPYSDGSHEYSGFIQYFNKREKKCMVYFLNDRSEEIPEPEKEILHTDRWFGALYYDILLNKYSGKRYYTLLAFDLNDRYSTKKIIELLHFDESMNPTFGLPVFETENGLANRVIFEYSAEVAMMMRYNDDLKMIVFDHLSPVDPALEGHYQFYGPDFSYDGYKFRNGIWKFHSDIDVRNR